MADDTDQRHMPPAFKTSAQSYRAHTCMHTLEVDQPLLLLRRRLQAWVHETCAATHPPSRCSVASLHISWGGLPNWRRTLQW